MLSYRPIYMKIVWRTMLKYYINYSVKILVDRGTRLILKIDVNFLETYFFKGKLQGEKKILQNIWDFGIFQYLFFKWISFGKDVPTLPFTNRILHLPFSYKLHNQSRAVRLELVIRHNLF